MAIVGLGYVGLPLALAFSSYRHVIGFDINKERIGDLKKGIDTTLEIEDVSKLKSENIFFTNNIADIKLCNCYIITVPTPIDRYKLPDTEFLESASGLVGSILHKNDLVIYESTVYPGMTEELCVPILEKESGLIYNQGFFCGYSPERINPGDKTHRLEDIVKITSGSTKEVGLLVDKLYKQIIKAGTYPVDTIKVAEAAKVIENTQRDINIALINELTVIFGKLNIDTEEVLKAAETKWNFIPFRPGLVGGHCIGVDPYYLTYKSKKVGYEPKMILAGRQINENMADYVKVQLVNKMNEKCITVKSAKVLFLGLSFKENCPDIRNSKVIDLYKNLKNIGCHVDIYDPWVDFSVAKKEVGIELTKKIKTNFYDVVILCVGHDQFKKMGVKEIRNFCKDSHVIYDLKYVFEKALTDLRL